MKGKIKSGMVNRMLMSMASMALLVATVAQNSTCFFHAHQDEPPRKAKQLRRF